jgi:hypothetical protein
MLKVMLPVHLWNARLHAECSKKFGGINNNEQAARKRHTTVDSASKQRAEAKREAVTERRVQAG